MRKYFFLSLVALLLLSGTAAAQARPPYATPKTDSYSVNTTDPKEALSELREQNCARRHRFSFRFAWGFHNWGSSPIRGMSKLGGAYNLRTSFSSYQLELMYHGRVCDHFFLGCGVGYESDVYKFTSPYVTFAPPTATGPGAFKISDSEVQASSRFVARYVSLPISFKWTPDDVFYIGLAAIPAINYSSNNTGLKHKYSTVEASGKDREEVTTVKPFKVDARLTVGLGGLTVFWQVSPFALFENMEQPCYPMKIGFMVGF